MRPERYIPPLAGMDGGCGCGHGHAVCMGAVLQSAIVYCVTRVACVGVGLGMAARRAAEARRPCLCGCAMRDARC